MASELAPAALESDAAQARIVNNALRREIDRLARGLDDSGPAWKVDDWSFAREDDNRGPNELASPPTGDQGRPFYACDLWKVVRYERPPAPTAQPPLVITPLLATNTGSLLDLLA